ncbi:carbohydrate kinase family protein [Leifsonia sp. Leaf264]|uniref:carbohydrate kinase family protein n=1 Tax=Leifsonia sp. Leaf264 TaxID=1736314 RepID=UPI0006F391F8|nr:sugar kinase [Leifsonia sp. Leaf264]KQO95709.1 hypothetical protein ASF30_18975 [Leifsonia sp. Leaf264]
MSRLFTLGEALAVFLADDFAAGRITPPVANSDYRRIVAGSESNVAVGVVRMGHEATLVTRVGTDDLGGSVSTQLSDWGIDARIIKDPRPTGVLVRGLNGVGAIHLRGGSAATALSPEDVDRAWSPDVAAVFVTGITAVRSPSAASAVERTVELARRQGALVIADPNLRPALGTGTEYARALRPLRGRVDVAVGDLAELAVLAGTEEDVAVRALLESGCRLVVTKLGAAGVRATDGAREITMPSAATRVVDTVGAGDSFAAGLIAGLLEDLPFEDSIDLGTRVAASVVATVGDVEGIPWRADLDASPSARSDQVRRNA